MNYFSLARTFILIPLLAVVVVSINTLFPFIVGKYAIFRTAVDLSLIFFLIGLLQKNEESVGMFKKIEILFRKPLFIAIGIFTLVFVIACFFGVNPSNSFWSNFERGEGGVQIIHLFLFFSLISLLFNDEKSWRRVLIFAILGGMLMSGYGLFAALGKPGFVGAKFAEPGFRFQGSIGNPAYVAAYAIFLMFYAFCLSLLGHQKNKTVLSKIIYILIFAVFFAVFILAATRGAFVGFVSALVIGAAYFAYTKPKLRPVLIGAIIILTVSVSTLVYFKDSKLVKSLPGSRIFDISFSTETFRHRAIEWKVAIDAFKERPLLGWGPENFIFAFDKLYNIRHFTTQAGFGAWFDRAHNIFLDYLSSICIIGLFCYVGVFAAFFWLFLID